ncbi:hypothetical protein ACI2VK_07635 [Ralstonia nicotianae]|uniref:hypothetical protein n=1 Tax=Ralstonia pseudosolanacearum TaxID=1310165 RepID=UPI001F22F82A|nr:hypothetical protein [Ralstonia solanacearum]
MKHTQAVPGEPGGEAQHHSLEVKQIVPGLCGGTCAGATADNMDSAAMMSLITKFICFITHSSPAYIPEIVWHPRCLRRIRATLLAGLSYISSRGIGLFLKFSTRLTDEIQSADINLLKIVSLMKTSVKEIFHYRYFQKLNLSLPPLEDPFPFRVRRWGDIGA